MEDEELTTADQYLSRALAYDINNDYEQALQYVNKAIQLNPNFSYAYDFHGNLYLKKGDYNSAVTDFNIMIQLNSQNAEGYINLGRAYIEKGDIDYAIELFTKAIEINPNNVNAYSFRYSSYEIKGNLDLAIEDCETVLRLEPNSQYANIVKKHLNEFKQKQEKWQVINKVKEYIQRIQKYSFEGNYDQAINESTEAIKLYADAPNINIIYGIRGMMYFYGNEKENAKADFETVLCIDPTSNQANIAREYLEKLM